MANGSSKSAGAVNRRSNWLVSFLRRHWLSIVILILVAVFIGTNSRHVSVNFFGLHFRGRLWLVLLGTALLGFFVGWQFQSRRQRGAASTNSDG
jgi:uncharacterized integral membrane protein